MSYVSLNVKHCQRCGEDHDKLEFRELSNPADEYHFWAICPTLREPLLAKVVAETTVE